MTHAISGMYERHFSIALLLSVFLHAFILGLVYLMSSSAGDDERVIICSLGPSLPIPPKLIPTDIGNAYLPKVANPKTGIPVPSISTDLHPEDEYVPPSVYNDNQSTPPITQDPGVKIEYTPPPIPAEKEEETVFTIVEKEPIPVIEVAPVYPDIARRTGLEGRTVVKLLVNKEGKVTHASILKSDAEIFNQVSIDAAMQWVFTPGMMNHGPVSVWVCIPFNFRLEK